MRKLRIVSLIGAVLMGCAVARIVTAAATPSPSWTQISWVTQTVKLSPGQTGELVFDYVVGADGVVENVLCVSHQGIGGASFEVCSGVLPCTVVRDAIGATVIARQWASWQECVGGTVTWPDSSTTPIAAAAKGVAPVIALGDVPNGTTLRVTLRVKAH